MAKYIIKTKDCRLNVKVKLSKKEKLYDAHLEFCSGRQIAGILKANIIKKHIIEYSGPIGISLYERFKKPVSKYDFFFMMEQIADFVQRLDQNSLIVSNILFDLKHVFINETTRELQFIYLPLETTPKTADILGFIEHMVYSITPMQEQESDYITRFIYYIKGMKQFSADQLEQYILKEDRKAVHIIKRTHAGPNIGHIHKEAAASRIDDEELETRKLMESSEARKCCQDTAAVSYEEESTRLLNEEKSTGLLNEEESTRLLNEEESTRLLNEETATGLLQEEAACLLTEHAEPPCFATLYRILTDEIIRINKPVFRIGKEKSYADYFVCNNNKVSRSHADIITKSQRCYIRDLNSKNRTYINGQAVPVQEEIELHDGDRIRLADEEFEFRR